MSAPSNSTLVWNPAPSVRSEPISQQRWEAHCEELCQMHATMTLDAIMAFMKVKRGFTASRHQYVLQFQKWGLSKYKASSSKLPLTKATEGSKLFPAHQPHQVHPLSASAPSKPFLSASFAAQSNAVDNLLSRSLPEVTSAELAKRPRTSMDSCSIAPKRLRYAENPGGKTDLQGKPSEAARTTPEANARRDADSDQLMSSFNSLSDQLSGLSLESGTNPFLTSEERAEMESQESPAPSSTSQKTYTSLVRSEISTIDSPGRAVSRPLSRPNDTIQPRSTKRISALELSNYARSGGCMDTFNRADVKNMEAIADFFYCAQLLDDAFVIYLMLYKALKRLGFLNMHEKLSAVLNVAKAINGLTQHAITRPMVEDVLADPDVTYGPYHPEIHFLHLYMAAHHQQKDPDLAKQHRDAALKCFDMVHDQAVDWQRVTPFATICHSYFESLLDPESETSAARTVCEHYFLMYDKGVDLKRRGFKTVIALLKDLKTDIPSWTLDCSVSLLKVLLDWCYHTCLDTEVEDGQSETQRREGLLGDLDKRSATVTELYCKFWAHWQNSRADRMRQHPAFQRRNESLESTLGLSASECLATCAQMVVDVSTLPLEGEPLPTGWDLAKFGLERLAKMTDSALAWYFVNAYTGRNFDDNQRRCAVISGDEEQHRYYVRAFSDVYLFVELPDLQVGESLLHSTSTQPTVPVARLPFIVHLGAATPQPSRSSDTGSKRSTRTATHAEGSCQFWDPPLNPSPTSSRTDLGSMRRIREGVGVVSNLRMDRISWSSGDGHSEDMGVWDVGRMIEQARHSLESMSLTRGAGVRNVMDELQSRGNQMMRSSRSLITVST